MLKASQGQEQENQPLRVTMSHLYTRLKDHIGIEENHRLFAQPNLYYRNYIPSTYLKRRGRMINNLGQTKWICRPPVRDLFRKEIKEYMTNTVKNGDDRQLTRWQPTKMMGCIPKAILSYIMMCPCSLNKTRTWEYDKN